MSDMITADEAQKLLDGTTPGPWRKRDCDVVVGEGLTAETICHFWRHWSNDEKGIEQTEPNAALTAAAPDLARTVIALHAQLADAKAAEQQRDAELQEQHRVRKAWADRALVAEAEVMADAMAWDEDSDDLLELDDIHDVRVDGVRPRRPLFLVIRDGQPMQVSHLETGDLPRQPDERGF